MIPAKLFWGRGKPSKLARAAANTAKLLEIRTGLDAAAARIAAIRRTLESYSNEMMEEVRCEHNEILQAIEDRNPDLASRLAEQ